MTFSELLTARNWRPIHNCPGRYVLSGVSPSLPLEALIGQEAEVRELHVEAARDTVLVVRLLDGGLISYKRPDGSYLHTLNTAEGFARKLLQLGIVVD
jgi:hypothetical protein